MKNIYFLLFSFIFYEILTKDYNYQETTQENSYIEDEEFVYSKIEDKKNSQDKKLEYQQNKIIDEKIELINIKEYTKKNEDFKEKSLESKNFIKSYPYLFLSLDNLIKIGKKIEINPSDIPIIWEYLLDLNTKKFFHFFKFNEENKTSFQKDEPAENFKEIKEKIDNTTTFYFNNIINNVFDEKSYLVLTIYLASFLMYLIPGRLLFYPKVNMTFLIICFFIYYFFLDYLYSIKYFFSSFIIYFLLIFNIEKIWNTIFCIENEHEIEENLKNMNNLFDPFNFQTKEKFLRKIMISFILLFFSIYITFRKFRSFYFYIFQFYLYRLIRVILIRYFKFNLSTPCEMQPFENFIDIILGIFSLFISNWYYYSNLSESHELFGLIVIYNIISFYYITSLDKFLFIYRNGLSDIYFEYSLHNEKIPNEAGENTNKKEKQEKSDKQEKIENNIGKKENSKNLTNTNKEKDKYQTEFKNHNKKKHDRDSINTTHQNPSQNQVKTTTKSDDSSDEEVFTLENIRKFESFQELVDKINLKRYYRFDIFNIGNIIDIVLITVSLTILIFSFFVESLYLLFLSIYIMNNFMKNNAIYISIKDSRLVSNIFQIFFMISIYNINFHSLEFCNIFSDKLDQFYNLKVAFKIIVKFALFSFVFKCFFLNSDFYSYFNIYYYTSYKFIIQEGVNYAKIKENSELMFRVKEVYNLKSALEEIFMFNFEKSMNFLNYIFENCKFLGRKCDFSVIEYSLQKSMKNYNIVYMLLDYFSLYFCYWLTFFVFKDSDDLFYILLYKFFKFTIIIKIFFLIFEYSKTPQQKFFVIFLNSIFFNRIICYFGLFNFDIFFFSLLSYMNKAFYLYNLENSFIMNVFFTLLELLEFRKYGNYLSFILILTFLCSKSLLFCIGKTKKETKFLFCSIILLSITGFIFIQANYYLFNLYDTLKEQIIKSSKIDWLGIFEFLYFNSINIPVKYSGKNFEKSVKNSVFIEIILVREILKFLLKIKMFIL